MTSLEHVEYRIQKSKAMHRFNVLPFSNPDLRRMLGDPGYYFLIKFPRVFMVVYEIIRESDLRHRRSLTDFFDIHNYVENNSCMLS